MPAVRTRLRPAAIASLLALVLVSACGDTAVDLTGDGLGVDGDGGPSVDAMWPPGCVPEPGAPQCDNCVDDDGDGTIDGFDVECTASYDDDEASFATCDSCGDNNDARKQDCFFDGNSGGGNDCSLHTCCLLDDPGTVDNECPANLQQGYNAADCALPQTAECLRDCAPLAPPGCDCFGCCTVCTDDPATPEAAIVCVDILLNTTVAPDCDAATVHDPAACFVCTKNTACGADCSADACVLCPGQTPGDLPDSCGEPACPNGLTTCAVRSDCTADQFCSNGCCIAAVE